MATPARRARQPEASQAMLFASAPARKPAPATLPPDWEPRARERTATIIAEMRAADDPQAFWAVIDRRRLDRDWLRRNFPALEAEIMAEAKASADRVCMAKWGHPYTP